MLKIRSLKQLSEPEVEPVSLAAAKCQVGLLPEQADDNALLLRLISTGRRLVEQRLGTTLATRQFRATFAPDRDYIDWRRSSVNTLRIPAPPLLVDGTHPLTITVGGVVVSSSTYSIDADSTPAVIRFTTWPMCDDDAPLVVTFWAGPPAGGRIEPAAESVILLFVAHAFKNREGVVTGTISNELPMGIETLLASISITGAY
jgi:uncharacterized phiE125 gp8 family phage protein